MEDKQTSVREIEFSPGYIITSDGRCFSTRRSVRKELKVSRNERGYLLVALHINGKLKPHKIHQLVTRYFIGPRPDGLQTRHLDGNKNNNDVSNLVYGTAQQNADDKKRHDAARGIVYKVRHFVRGAGQVLGERHASAKLTELDVQEARAKYRDGMSCMKLCDLYPIEPPSMYRMLTGATWKHVPGAVKPGEKREAAQ